MPTLIDAFLVEFGIDPAKFVAGAKVILESQKKSQETAKKTADEVENEAKREGEAFKKTTDAAAESTKKMDANARQMTEFFSRLRGQVLSLFAIFTAGKGLKDFIQDQITSTAALGRTSYALGLNVKDLAAWRGAVEATGGSAQDAIAGVGGLVQEFQRFTLTGQSDVLQYFRTLTAEANRLGVPFTALSQITTQGGLKDVTSVLLQMADVFSRMNPVRAAELARMMNLPPGLINLLLQGKDAVQKLLDVQRQLAPSPADVKAYQDLQKSWQQMTATSESAGRSILTSFAPAIQMAIDFINKFAGILQTHQPFMKAFFATLATGAVIATIALFPIIGTVGLVAAGIAALAAGVGVLYDSWVAWTTGGKTALSGLWDHLASFFAFAKAHAKDDMHDVFIKAFDDILAKAVSVGPKIGPALLTAFREAMAWLTDRLNQLWNAVTGHDLIRPATPVPTKPTSTPGMQRAAPMETIHPAHRGDVDKLMQMGWTRDQAIGIAANLQRESKGDIGAVGDRGQAFGLAQWHPDRQAQFAKLFGHDIRASTRDEQLKFIDWELRHSESGAGKALALATTAPEAARIVSNLYERPAAPLAEAATRAAAAARMAQVANTYSTSSSSSVTNNRNSNNQQIDTRIGDIIVNAPRATDADQIAAAIGPALRRKMLSLQANAGAS